LDDVTRLGCGFGRDDVPGMRGFGVDDGTCSQARSIRLRLCSHFGLIGRNQVKLRRFSVRCKFKRSPSWGSKVRSIVRSTAIVCLLLTVWSAVAFAAHHHSNGAEAAKCTVCVAAHTAAPRANANVQKVRLTPVFAFQEVPVSTKERFVAFALTVRPPPVS
jgi:hypothetical protein